MIEVHLPQQTAGLDIIEAFNTAGTFAIDSKHKWEAQIENVDYEYTTEGNLVILKQKVTAYPLSLKRPIFGVTRHKEWYQDNASVKLEPLDINEQYKKVMLSTSAFKYVDERKRIITSDDPENEIFSPFRPHLSKILTSFISNLQT